MRNFISKVQNMPQANNSSLRPLQVDFGAGEGYVEKTLKVTW